MSAWKEEPQSRGAPVRLRLKRPQHQYDQTHHFDSRQLHVIAMIRFLILRYLVILITHFAVKAPFATLGTDTLKERRFALLPVLRFN